MLSNEKLKIKTTRSFFQQPFLTTNAIKEGVQFRYFQSDQFSTNEIRYIKKDQNLEAYNPSIKLELSGKKISHDVHIPVEELSVTLVIRDKVINIFKPVKSWNLSEDLNEIYELKNELYNFSNLLNIEFVCICHPSFTKKRSVECAQNKSNVLDSVRFKLSEQTNSKGLKQKFCGKEYFINKGMPEDTIYHIEKKPGFTQNISDLFTVIFNKEFEETYDIILKVKNAYSVYWAKEFQSTIYFEMIYSLLKKDDYKDLIEESSDNQLGKVVESILVENNYDVDNVAKILKEHDGTSRLRAICRSISKQASDFKNLSF